MKVFIWEEPFMIADAGGGIIVAIAEDEAAARAQVEAKYSERVSTFLPIAGELGEPVVIEAPDAVIYQWRHG